MNDRLSASETHQGDPMESEFDTMAAWTAEAVRLLGPDHAIPAGCRGSGSPAALSWLLESMAVRSREPLLDIGAGVGGPAAYAALQSGARPVLIEPMLGACRAARQLFDLTVIAGNAEVVPVASGSVPAAWSLGVLCTISDKAAMMGEARRVLRSGGRLGLLVFVRTEADLPEQPDGNEFPTSAELTDLLADNGFELTDTALVDDLASAPTGWDTRTRQVSDLIGQRHGDDPQWRVAAEQAAIMGRLLSSGNLAATLMTAIRP